MRIDEGNRSKSQLLKTDSPSAPLPGSPTSARFRTALELAYSTEHPVDLEEMLERIDSAGRDLVTRRGVEELKTYREAVRDFLKETVRSAFLMKEDHRWDQRGNPRDYRLVMKINHNLDELTRLVLQAQAPSMDVMAKLDEIRGMLIDLQV